MTIKRGLLTQVVPYVLQLEGSSKSESSPVFKMVLEETFEKKEGTTRLTITHLVCSKEVEFNTGGLSHTILPQDKKNPKNLILGHWVKQSYGFYLHGLFIDTLTSLFSFRLKLLDLPPGHAEHSIIPSL